MKIDVNEKSLNVVECNSKRLFDSFKAFAIKRQFLL